MLLSASDIRQLNANRIFHALRRHPGSSQRKLVELTGIDQATVSVIIKQLEESGFLERNTRSVPGRVGRPRHSHTLSPNGGLLLGASVETNYIAIIATHLDGSIIARKRISSSKDLRCATEKLHQGVEQLLAETGHTLNDVRGLGVGVPAILDKQGHIILAPNLQWHNVDMATLLKQQFQFPTYVDNDTNAAALAEKLFGAAHHINDFMYIAGYSGIGSGLFFNGQLYKGAQGFSGEIGHVKVVPDGRPCGCGGRGCLETYASERAILEQLRKAGLHPADMKSVSELANNAHPDVLSTLNEAGHHLGAVIANLLATLNSEIIILGGSYIEIADYFFPVVKHAILENLPYFLKTEPLIIPSPLGTDSTPMGGVSLALEGFLSEANWFNQTQ